MKFYSNFQEGSVRYKKYRIKTITVKWFCQLVT